MTAAPAEEISFPSRRGPVRALYHRPSENGGVVVMVGGFDGDFDGPADALYQTLAEDLSEHGIGALRLDFRDRRSPGIVEDGATDVMAGIEELGRHGVGRFGLVGHSFGAAVMITVATRLPEVETVVSLSAQTAGAQGVALVAPRPLLLIHGLDDIRLSPDCSRYLYGIAGEPKELVLLEGARHSLRQRREDVRSLSRDWLVKTLAR
jgi:alpha/beta superfamily hydrolase